jgi:DNA invertase Pin-like site-specific DNA recombinase
VRIWAAEQPVDISTAVGKAFLDTLKVFAKIETNLRRERQAEGIAAARKLASAKGAHRRSNAQKSCFACNRVKDPARSPAISVDRASLSIRGASTGWTSNFTNRSSTWPNRSFEPTGANMC